MRNVLQTIAAVAGLAALMSLTPLPALAQADNGKSHDTVRADQLDRQAEKLYNSPTEWKKASTLHEKAADLRAPEDPRLLADLEIAASLAAHAKDYRRAEQLMARLAESAATVGDVERAAHGYLTAAYAAAKTGAASHVRNYVDKARLLAYSPLLSEEACDCIRDRVREADAVLIAAL